MGRIIPTKTTGASEAAGCIFQHFGRFGTPDVIHTDQGPAFCNELFSELSRLSQVEHSFATAYSKEENGLVERANQEIMRHLRAMHDKWSYKQLPMVQRIMNTVEKTSTMAVRLMLVSLCYLEKGVLSCNPVIHYVG